MVASWDYRRCPNPACRSYRTVPASFPRMVEIARELGINHNTPFRDVIRAFRAVWREEGLLSLGLREFLRILNLVIEEAERYA